MRLIKLTILACVILFFLPSPPDDQKARFGLEDGNATSTPEIVGAAVTTASDVGSFCERQPAVCEMGQNLYISAKAKIGYSLQKIINWSEAPKKTHTQTNEEPTKQDAIERD